jgi:hypothetical protein
MKKRAPKKLVLGKETLRALGELAGGTGEMETADRTACTWCYECVESVDPQTCQGCKTT